jgi:hypothetical protein
MIDIINPKLAGVVEWKAWQKGRLIEHWREDNTVVDASRTTLIRILGGDGDAVISNFGVGTSDQATDVTQTSLENQILRPLMLGLTETTDTGATFTFTLENEDFVGLQINELGLFTRDDVLFSRKVRSTPLLKAADMHIVGNWMINYQ